MAVSSVRHRRLIQELKRYREEAGYTQEDAATELDWSKSKQFKLESGAIPVKVSDVRAMCDLYGISGDRRETLLTLARDARQKGWWHGYGDAVPTWFEVYLGLENDASRISTYQSELFHGLLQTPEYSRQIIRAYHPTLDERERERQIEVRRTRQARLRSDKPIELHAILNESVLRRSAPDPSVLRAQLHHLLELMELPNVTVLVLPYSAGLHPAMDGTYEILSFPESPALDVVYLENRTGSLYLEEK